MYSAVICAGVLVIFLLRLKANTVFRIAKTVNSQIQRVLTYRVTRIYKDGLLTRSAWFKIKRNTTGDLADIKRRRCPFKAIEGKKMGICGVIA